MHLHPGARLALTLLPLLAAASLAHADVILPAGLGSASGNANFTTSPFNASDSSTRIQQLFSGTAFGLQSGPVEITGIAFRPSSTGPGMTFPRVQVDLSTVSESSVSSTFANNVGSNDTVDFNSSLTLPAVQTPPAPGSQGQFEVSIPFSTPFLYNPAAGNLVVDIRVFNAGTTYLLNAQTTSTGTLVFSELAANGGNVNSSTGIVQDALAVTDFTTVPVPEPASFAVVGSALIGLGALRRRRRS